MCVIIVHAQLVTLLQNKYGNCAERNVSLNS